MVACPVRAPCLGVTLPASPECASPQCWGWLCGGCVVVGVLPTRGRLVVVAGVDGAGCVRVRGCGRVCWPRCGWWCWSWLGSMVRDICMFEHVRGCGWLCWLSSGLSRWSLVDDFCVFKGMAAPSGRRLGRLGRLGCVLVDDLCGAGVGLLGVRGCGRGCWSSSRSSRCLRVVASRVGEASLGGVRLRSRLWVVGVTRKDV